MDVRLAGSNAHQREQRTAGRELHRDVGHALADAVGIDLDDVRVDEARCGLSLLLEAFDEIRVRAEFLQHDLNGNGAVEHLVPPHVDAAHSAGADLALKQEVPVVAEDARRLNERFAHRIILHPLKGQKTNAPSPRRFARGTVPQ